MLEARAEMRVKSSHTQKKLPLLLSDFDQKCNECTHFIKTNGRRNKTPFRSPGAVKFGQEDAAKLTGACFALYRCKI
jgi:hypothetical protein